MKATKQKVEGHLTSHASSETCKASQVDLLSLLLTLLLEVLSAIIYMHELTYTHDWLWLTAEIEQAPPTQGAQTIPLS